MMNAFRRFALALLLLIPTVTVSRCEEITLAFPSEAVGIVSGFTEEEQVFSVKAIGNISVENNLKVKLSLSEAATADLSFLKQLPAHNISSLELGGGTLDSDDLGCLVELQHLESLDLSRCKFAESAFDNLEVLPALIELRVGTGGRQDILSWVGKHDRLETLYCFPSLQVQDLELLGAMPNLRSTTVTLGENAQRLIDYLPQFPSLEYLGMTVKTEPADAELNFEPLASLQRLEELRWFYGTVQQHAIDALSGIESLRRLHFVQVNPSPGFWPGIKNCSGLESLYCSFAGESEPLSNQEVPFLASMPNLREWPKLQYLNQDSLKLISKCPWITSLTLQSLAEGATEEYLCDTLKKLHDLRHVDLQNMRFTDGGLAALTKSQQLETLKLFSTEVTGDGFAHLVSLPKLKTIHWFGGITDDGPVPLQLASLSHLPDLEVMEIGGSDFMPQDLYALAGCKKLKRIRLWGGGFADDSVAEALAVLPDLAGIFLSDNCVVTDRGAKALAKCKSLQEVSVGGFFTADGFRALASLPKLKMLNARSVNVTGREFEVLKSEARNVPSLYGGSAPRTSVVMSEDGILRKKLLGEDSIKEGADGILRKISLDEESLREQMDRLEGKHLRSLAADEKSLGLPAEQLKGKVVLIDFWGSWCGPCRAQMKKLKAIRESYEGKGFEILGIHTSYKADDLTEFIDEKGIRWPNIVDESDALREAFQVPHFPSYFLVDRQGILRVALAHPLGLEAAVKQMVAEE